MLHDRLLFGVKHHHLDIRMRVAKEALLPATKAMLGNGGIDIGHAYLNLFA